MRAARPWHLLTGLVSAAAFVVQIVLVWRGVNVLSLPDGSRPGLGERLARFFSFFTIQSNVLVILAAAGLAARPDRDGRWWQVLRLAGLVGITVTVLVYLVALRPILDLSGMSAVSDFGLHIATPVLAIGGWLLFDPRRPGRPRWGIRELGWSLLWPAAYVCYSLIRGELTGWYPYPFVDVTKLGYPETLRNLALVIVLMLVVGAAYVLVDRRLGSARRSAGALP